MAPASNEEQFKFLISCIRYSNNGKVDFGEVARECSIVSKGAAAKRYERMMRAHGIAPNAATTKPASTRSSQHDREDSKTSRAPKKRKVAEYMSDAGDDDEETFGSVKSENPGIKGENCDTKEHLMSMVKEENSQPLSFSDAANLLQYYDIPAQYHSFSAAGTVEPGYNSGDILAGPTCYDVPFENGYNLQDGMFESFDPYMESRMESVRPEEHLGHYPTTGFPAHIQGRYDSPVILE